jgi:GT2 family glycosyltransferase
MDLPVPQQAGSHGHTSRHWISEGNHAFAQGAYREALRCYVVARELFPALSSTLEGNLQRCTQKLLAEQTPPAQQLRLPCSPAPLVSILVPVHGQLHTTLACLSAIADHSGPVALEVLLLDDASDDVTREALEQVAGLRLISQAQNLGFLRNCNAGAREARGRYLLLLNNDTLVQPGWLEAMLATAEGCERIGAVGAQLRYPDGRLQEVGGIVWRDGSAARVGDRQWPSSALLSRPRDVDYCSGAALLVRKPLWEKLNGFDTRYAPAYYEDTDLCFRIRETGQRVVVQPKALVIHFEGISHGRDLQAGAKAHQLINQTHFAERWRTMLQRQHQTSGSNIQWASERAYARPMILVVDHKLPEPDRDAGSRSIVHLMRGLVNAGALVAFWPHNPELADGYRTQLEEMGIQLLADNQQALSLQQLRGWIQAQQSVLDWVLFSRPDVADVVLSEIGCQPDLHFAYYGHDLHHRRLERQAALTQDSGILMKHAVEARQQEQRVWQQADLIYYPAFDEVEEVRTWISETHCKAEAQQLPVFSYATAELSEPALCREPPCSNQLLFVAGFAHPPNAEAVLWFVDEVWPLVKKRQPMANLWLVGSHPPHAIRSLEAIGIHVTGMVSEAELQGFYRQSRIAIAPIRYGAGVNGKVVEAIRYGVPCVCTPQAARGFFDPGDALRVASTAAAFADACHLLLTSDDLWRQQALAGLAYVRQHFSIAKLEEALSPMIAPLSRGARRNSTHIEEGAKP